MDNSLKRPRRSGHKEVVTKQATPRDRKVSYCYGEFDCIFTS